MSNEEHQESEFDKAFSESAEEQETAAAKEDGGTQEGGSADTEQETDTSTDKGETGETDGEAENDGEEEDWKAKAEEERKAREVAEQKMRSWDGRLRKSSEELTQERQARKELEQRLSALEQQSKDGDRQKLQEWLDDYGDDEEFAHISNIVRDRLEALNPDTDDNAAGERNTQDEPPADQATEQPEVDEDVKSHFAAIEEKHSDWRELAGELDGWIESLPGKQALEYTRVKEQGTAEEVIAMLDDLKASKRGNSKGNTDDDADAMAAVRHRSGGKRPKGRADKNDFDGAWAEAVGQKQ